MKRLFCFVFVFVFVQSCIAAEHVCKIKGKPCLVSPSNCPSSTDHFIGAIASTCGGEENVEYKCYNIDGDIVKIGECIKCPGSQTIGKGCLHGAATIDGVTNCISSGFDPNGKLRTAVCVNFTNHNICECDCSQCTGPRDAGTPGVVVSYSGDKCDCSGPEIKCTGTPTYKCKQGYYKESGSGEALKCVQCPVSDSAGVGKGRAGTTDSAGNENTISDCYITIPKDGSYKDEKGFFKLQDVTDETIKVYYK